MYHLLKIEDRHNDHYAERFAPSRDLPALNSLLIGWQEQGHYTEDPF